MLVLIDISAHLVGVISGASHGIVLPSEQRLSDAADVHTVGAIDKQERQDKELESSRVLGKCWSDQLKETQSEENGYKNSLAEMHSRVAQINHPQH